MAKPRNDLVDRLQYLALRLAAMVLHWFPIDANLRTARAIGDVGHRLWFVRKSRKRALHNVAKSFPDLSEASREEIVRQSFQHLVMFSVELLFTTRLIHLDTWSKYIELHNVNETIRLMTRRPYGGLIMLTGHYGNWEILGYVLATLGFPTTSVARPLDNPYLSEFIFGVRERTGQRIIGKKGATSEITEVLDSKGTVGFIADQNAGTKGVFVDFFGRKASTYKSIALVAMQYRVPVVIGYARRLGNRFRYRVGVEDIIYPEDWDTQDDPMRYITQRYTKAIEDVVRAEPGQYLWAHRRWKTRPKGEEPEPYD